MLDNKMKIIKLLDFLTPILAEYLYRHLKNKYKQNWWQAGVLGKLEEHHKRDLPSGGEDQSLLNKLDIDKLTILIAIVHWEEIFLPLTTSRVRTYIREIRDIRIHFYAHRGMEPIEDREVSRAADTITRVLEIIGEHEKILDLQTLLQDMERFQPAESEQIDRLDNKVAELEALRLLLKDEEEGSRLLHELAEQGRWIPKHILSYDLGFDLFPPKEIKEKVKYPVELINLLLNAENQLTPNLLCVLGDIYQLGLGVPKNQKSGTEYFFKAAEQGAAKAQYLVGKMYEEGKVVPKDYQKAIYWYGMAVGRDSKEAQFSLGYLYYEGKVVSQDFEKAWKLCQKAANQGSNEAKYLIGSIHLKRGSYKKALFWLQKAADRDIAEAQYLLGYIYYKGKGGVEKNYKVAMQVLVKAADQGIAEAQFLIGEMYCEGKKGEIKRNYNKAMQWYLKAAHQGHAEAQIKLAHLYNKGNVDKE
ncbi:Swt1 family HEPN domain-containing protein [Neobacillus sp. SAB-20_R2A]|uniref:Swt1 family HEPN domain-containing protein n=1 Tax=Neobacillus sp. SAB-20_R2A TaxID=3120519 RepID=UPI003C6E7527